MDRPLVIGPPMLIERPRIGAVRKATLVLFGAFFFLVNQQNLIIHELGSGAAIKPYHVFGVLMFPLFLIHSAPVPSLPVTFFFLIVAVTSALAYLVEGVFNSLLINYGFALYVYLLGMLVQRTLGLRCLTVLRAVAVSMLIMVLVKNYIYRDQILHYLRNPVAHPVVPWFYGGGPNLEATWISLFPTFFLGSAVFFPLMLIGGVANSIIYASRTGVAICVMCLAYRFISNISRPKQWVIAGLCAALGVGMVFWINPFALERFMYIGADTGSAMRLALWETAWRVFADDPLHFRGAGNAIGVVERAMGTPLIEDNVHNYYFQVLLEFGIIGLLAYAWVLLRVLRQEVRSRFSGGLGGFVLIYGIASLVQFRGAEPMLWLVLGIHEASQRLRVGAREHHLDPT